MNTLEQEFSPEVNRDAWRLLEGLVSPDPDLRSHSLEELQQLGGVFQSPLGVYLLATRLTDPELNIRLQAVKLLGNLLGDQPVSGEISAESIKYLQEYLTSLEKAQLGKLLEVSAEFVSAEAPVGRILKLCSYAGKSLSGIVNDQKLPVKIRQQAIYFCGEVGFLTTKTALKTLVRRIEKGRKRSEIISRRKVNQEQESLYIYALSALGKLE